MKDFALRLSAVLFLVMALMHLARIIYKFPIVIGDFYIPLRISLAAFVILFSLAVWIFTLLKK